MKKYLKTKDIRFLKTIASAISICLFLCCSGNKTVVKKNLFETNKTIIPNQSLEDNINPNSIVVDIKIVKVYKAPKLICDTPKTKVCLVEIVEINKKGFGLLSDLIKGQNYLIRFAELNPELKVGCTIKATAIEIPCFNSNDISSFLVVKYDKGKQIKDIQKGS